MQTTESTATLYRRRVRGGRRGAHDTCGDLLFFFFDGLLCEYYINTPKKKERIENAAAVRQGVVERQRQVEGGGTREVRFDQPGSTRGGSGPPCGCATESECGAAGCEGLRARSSQIAPAQQPDVDAALVAISTTPPVNRRGGARSPHAPCLFALMPQSCAVAERVVDNIGRGRAVR